MKAEAFRRRKENESMPNGSTCESVEQVIFHMPLGISSALECFPVGVFPESGYETSNVSGGFSRTTHRGVRK